MKKMSEDEHQCPENARFAAIDVGTKIVQVSILDKSIKGKA